MSTDYDEDSIVLLVKEIGTENIDHIDIEDISDENGPRSIVIIHRKKSPSP